MAGGDGNPGKNASDSKISPEVSGHFLMFVLLCSGPVPGRSKSYNDEG
jgi:hypothetical protein